MTRLSIRSFIRSQRLRLPPVERADMAGKTILVVGANVGVGLATAKHFAAMGPARLILACRSQLKGNAAAAEIAHETAFKGAEVRLVELGEFASVVAFADALEKDDVRLDVLICNAGINMFKSVLTSDGWEFSLQVNHLSTALITLLLLPRLLTTADKYSTVARIVVVASESHSLEVIPPVDVAKGTILQSLNAQTSANVMAKRYQMTKLYNVLHVRALTGHLPHDAPVIITSVTPGFTVSQLHRSVPWAFAWLFTLAEKLLGRTPEVAARNLVLAALATDETAGTGGIKGRYIQDCKVAEEGDFVLTAEGAVAQEKLWEETIAVLRKVDPAVGNAVDRYLSGVETKA